MILSSLASLGNKINMPKLNTKLLLFGGAGIFVLFIILVIAGVIPGLKKSSTPPVTGSLLVWTVGEGSSEEKIAWEDLIKKFNGSYPQVSVSLKNFDSFETYESALLDGLASGEGPDVFMVLNHAVPRYANKISPAPETLLPLSELKSRFPTIVERDFAPRGIIYGLPLSIDTLALIYNRNLLDQGAVNIPQSWEEFVTALSRLTVRDASGISFAGAALGTSENVQFPADILSLIMLQSGVKMTDESFTSAKFNEEKGENALVFYTQFSDEKSSAYTWNASLPDSLDMFTQEKVAMLIGYQETLSVLKERNSFLSIGIAEVPNPSELIANNKKLSYPRYFGLSVSRQSKDPELAWKFVTRIAGNDDVAGSYMATTKKPPALRSLLVMNRDDATIGVFARQALVAVSWPQVDNKMVDRLFSSVITKVVEGRAAPMEALKEAADELSRAMKKQF